MQALAMPASRYIFGTLPWYSVTMVCAILSALLLAQGEEKRRGLPKDTVVDLALRLILGGVPEEKLRLFTDYGELEQTLLAQAPKEGTVAIFFELYAKPIAMGIRKALLERAGEEVQA